MAAIQDQKIENKVADARGFGCKVLETMKIRASRFVQGHNFSVNNSVGGQIIERLGNLRESFVEVLVIPRVQDGFARSDSDGTVAIQFDFVGPI